MIAAAIGMVGAVTPGMDHGDAGRVCGRDGLEAAKVAPMLQNRPACVTVGLGFVTRGSCRTNDAVVGYR
jgi:hypothetical protein